MISTVEAIPAPGVYGLVRPRDYTNPTQFYLFSLPPEDVGKLEGELDVSVSDLVPLSPSMLGTVSGRVRSNEGPLEALIRETREELGFEIGPEDLTPLGLPPVDILQQRPDGLYLFTIVGYIISLSLEQIFEVGDYLGQSNRRMEPVDITRNPREEENVFRPFLWSVFAMMLSQLEQESHQP